MNKLYKSFLAIIGLGLACLMSASVVADQHKEGKAEKEMLAEMWVMVPKEGKQQALEDAIKEHVKFRESKNDTRDWHIYAPVLGSKLDRIAVRANNFTWADMDTYRDWSMNQGVSENWQQTAGQYVDHYHHYLAIEDRENSHWGPDVKYKYVGVTSYQPKLGHRSAINEDIKTMSDAAREQNWPYNWAFSTALSGQGEINLAVPYENWGAMAPPEMEFMEVLSTHMGDEDKAKELMKRWAGHFEKVEFNVWELRTDLMQ